MDIIAFHSNSKQKQFSCDDTDIRTFGHYHYNMSPIMSSTIQSGEWLINTAYVGEWKRLDISNIYSNELSNKLFTLFYNGWNNELSKIILRWEKRRTVIY